MTVTTSSYSKTQIQNEGLKHVWNCFLFHSTKNIFFFSRAATIILPSILSIQFIIPLFHLGFSIMSLNPFHWKEDLASVAHIRFPDRHTVFFCFFFFLVLVNAKLFLFEAVHKWEPNEEISFFPTTVWSPVSTSVLEKDQKNIHVVSCKCTKFLID